MPNLSTMTLPELTDLLKRDFLNTSASVVKEFSAQSLFIKDDRTSSTDGDKVLYTEEDSDTFAGSKYEADLAPLGKAGVGYSKQLQARRFGKAVQVTWEMRRYNKYKDVMNKWLNIRMAIPERTELDLSHRLAFAQSVSYTDRDGNLIDLTTGDGLAVVSAVHTLKFSSTTYSNVITGNPAFSRTALETAEGLMATQILNNFGEVKRKNFNKLVFSNQNTTGINLAKELMLSTATINSNQNAGVVNVYKGTYDIVVLPYYATTTTGAIDVAKKNNWFIIAQNGNPAESLQAYYTVWENNNMVEPEKDGQRDTWTYGVRGSYDIGFVSPRGLLASYN